MVANGVTTVRFMIGTPELLALCSRSANGEIEAWSIFVESPHLTGREQGNNFVVNTPEDAREAIHKSKAARYDFIKVTTFIKPCWTRRQLTYRPKIIFGPRPEHKFALTISYDRCNVHSKGNIE